MLREVYQKHHGTRDVFSKEGGASGYVIHNPFRTGGLFAYLSKPPETVEDVYLRLHLLSHRLANPNTINLEAGLYVTAGMRVLDVREGTCTPRKAVEYAHNPNLLDKKFGLLFLRNSMTGAVEVRHNRKPNKMNEELHKNTND